MTRAYLNESEMEVGWRWVRMNANDEREWLMNRVKEKKRGEGGRERREREKRREKERNPK